MGAIAYITDSKLLELHRLNAHRTMNFWRLSAKTGFTDFQKGDLVFFLSKDKAHMRKKEKGIVGYGRLESIHVASIQTMWKNYGKYNGYNTLEEFKDAIRRVNKSKELPKKISSLYLVDVAFFQVPIYLSECGMTISNNVESYIYLKPEEVALKILDIAKDAQDLWTSGSDASMIEREELRYSLYLAHRYTGDLPCGDRTLRRAYKTLKDAEDYELIQHSHTSACRLSDDSIEVLFYHDKDIDDRLILGQAALYRYYMDKNHSQDLPITFRVSDHDPELESLIGYMEPEEV